MNTTTPNTKQSIRLTIPVSLEVHEAFTRISKASGMPVGRAMGEWLGDTLDAAQFLADTLEKARFAPRLVAQQLHAYAQGMADETGTILAQIREDSSTRHAGQHAQRADLRAVLSDVPPLCNTGGKVPPVTNRPRGGKPSKPLPPAKVQAYADTNGKPPGGAR